MKSPLPPREGISANRLRAPGGNQTHDQAHLPVPASVGQWLHECFPQATSAQIASLLDPGHLCDAAGQAVSLSDPVVPGGFYFFHRPVPAEPRVPFELGVVYEDDHLLVVDKPHFLASTPNGRFVRESVVTRLRVERDEPDLVAIHRLDRVTAGLLVLSRQPATRGTYQRLFQDRKVDKVYRALARLGPAFDAGQFPLTRTSRLTKIKGDRQVFEQPGTANAQSRIEFLGTHDDASSHGPVGEFALFPHTGKTHQLRVHMHALGLPILGDQVYPHDLGPDPYDFSSPLQLLAQQLRFTDPLTMQPHAFVSRLELAAAAVAPR